jgi:hypothetical protein
MQNTTTQPRLPSLAHSLAIGQLYTTMHNNAVVRLWGLERTLNSRVPVVLRAVKNGRVLEITAQHGSAEPVAVTPEHVPALLNAIQKDNQRRESERHFDNLARLVQQRQRVGA